MAVWTPTSNVFDLTLVVDNLLSYIAANNGAALRWANGGVALPEFVYLYPNAPGRLISKFPALIVIDQAYQTSLDSDILIAALQLKFEGCVSGPNLDELVLKTKKYAMALESMLANVPSATITGSATKHGALHEIGSNFDLTGQLKHANSYLAIFQTKCLYKLEMVAY